MRHLPSDFGIPIDVHANEPKTIYVPIKSDSEHLRRLARVDSEVLLEMKSPPTLSSVLYALEAPPDSALPKQSPLVGSHSWSSAPLQAVSIGEAQRDFDCR
jgi:hypothetical protein